MATAAQILANQANARHSTGPRTPEGKARSASNALRHGLTATRLALRDDDERAEFETLRDALLEQLDPQGAIETVVFGDLLHAAWNLHRYRAIEAGYGLSPEDESACALLDRLTRYLARAQRAFYRALRELRALQTGRALRALKLAVEEEAAVPAIADINELTKQTRSEVTAEALDLAVQMLERETGAFHLAAIRDQRSPAAPQAPASAAAPRS